MSGHRGYRNGRSTGHSGSYWRDPITHNGYQPQVSSRTYWSPGRTLSDDSQDRQSFTILPSRRNAHAQALPRLQPRSPQPRSRGDVLTNANDYPRLSRAYRTDLSSTMSMQGRREPATDMVPRSRVSSSSSRTMSLGSNHLYSQQAVLGSRSPTPRSSSDRSYQSFPSTHGGSDVLRGVGRHLSPSELASRNTSSSGSSLLGPTHRRYASSSRRHYPYLDSVEYIRPRYPPQH